MAAGLLHTILAANQPSPTTAPRIYSNYSTGLVSRAAFAELCPKPMVHGSPSLPPRDDFGNECV